MVNFGTLRLVGKRVRNEPAARRPGQQPPASAVEALVAPPAQASPEQAEHFVQFALQFLH
jgi:hypothetical protein